MIQLDVFTLALRSAIVGPDLIDKFIHSLLRNREAQVFDDLAKVKSMWRESLYVRQMLQKKTSIENSEKNIKKKTLSPSGWKNVNMFSI